MIVIATSQLIAIIMTTLGIGLSVGAFLGHHTALQDQITNQHDKEH